MAATQGRDLLLKLGNAASPEVYATVAGLTTKSIAGANGTLDVTTDDDDGVRKLLAGKYGMAFTISASGIAPDTSAYAGLRTKFLAGTVHNFQLDNPASTGGATYQGSFAITSFEETGETDGALSFSITLESAGVITAT